MRVTHLSLGDFRNYEVAEVPFSKGANLVVGRNGQGKTNLVEAISYFSSLSSHRVTNESSLIRAGHDSAIARMQVAVDDRDVLLEIQINKDRPNRAQINRNTAKPRELTRWFHSVLFAPEDLSLVRGEPGLRRRFLDEAVASRNPVLSGVLSDYDRVVRQRTTLLKSVRGGNRKGIEATLELWDSQLVELGTRIILARRSLVEALTNPLREAYRSIVEVDHSPSIFLSESIFPQIDRSAVSRETTSLNTLPPGSPSASSASNDVSRETSEEHLVSRETVERAFRSSLARVRSQELDRGVTLVGPHRDDAVFSLNHLPVKGYASHGETWSFALALKLGLASLYRQESPAGDPVIILDDVFAELDSARRSALMSEVSKFEQVIVTAAVESDVPQGEWQRIEVAAGHIIGGDLS